MNEQTRETNVFYNNTVNEVIEKRVQYRLGDEKTYHDPKILKVIKQTIRLTGVEYVQKLAEIADLESRLLEGITDSSQFRKLPHETRTSLAKASVVYEKQLGQSITSEMIKQEVTQQEIYKMQRQIDRLSRLSSQFYLDSEQQNMLCNTLVVLRLLSYSLKSMRDIAGPLAYSLQTGEPVTIISPRCLRYYYDEKGEQQVIDTIENYEVSPSDVRTKEEFEAHIEKELHIPKVISSLGFPVKVVVPVMDHEILRPEQMNTQENFTKVSQYIDELTRYFQMLSQLLWRRDLHSKFT